MTGGVIVAHSALLEEVMDGKGRQSYIHRHLLQTQVFHIGLKNKTKTVKRSILQSCQLIQNLTNIHDTS